MTPQPLLSLSLALAANAVAQETPRIELEPKTFRSSSGEYAAEVGHLPVPENRTAEKSRTIELALVRLKSTAAKPGAPLFVLPGGPGDSATNLATSPVWTKFLELGDVVLMDPRGVGRSEPDLMWESARMAPELLFTDRKQAVGHVVELCKAAAEDFRGEGVDLAGYHALEMADDLEDLREALGYAKVNLLGHSFGTHQAQLYLQRHPGSVARVVCVGTAGTGDLIKLPSELDASLRKLSELVVADPVVGKEMPDLYAAVVRTVAGLAKEPLAVPIAGASANLAGEVMLGPFGFQMILLFDLGDTNDLPVIPRLVHSVEKRDPSLVRWFLEKRMGQFKKLPVLMLAARGASGATPERWERVRREAEKSPFGLARCMFSPESDRALGAGDIGDAARAPVKSDVPALFVSGTLDANTPPEQAERVRAGFKNSGHVIVENGGHEDLLPDPRVQALMFEFLAGAKPADKHLENPKPTFAKLEGPDPSVDHPSLAGSR